MPQQKKKKDPKGNPAPAFRILIVDDKKENRYLLESMFGAKGYMTESAANGIEAQGHLKKEHFDVIISDLLMPKMDGFQLLRECKKDPLLNKIPFIIYTATYTDKKDIEFGLSLGAARYIIKPAEPEVLLYQLDEIIKQSTEEVVEEPGSTIEDNGKFDKEYIRHVTAKLDKKILDLEKSEERYRTLAEASPDQIFIVGKDDTIKFANTALLKLFRLPYDQVVGTPRKNLFPPDIADSQSIHFKKVFETGEMLKTGERIQFGMQEFWIDTSLVPLKDKTGNVTAVLGVSRDTTERKQAEEAVAASQKLLQDVTDNSNSLIYACDPQGRFMLINRSLATLFGVPRESLIGKTREAILPPEIAAAYRDNDLKVIDAMKPIVVEEENNEPDGKHTYLSVKFPIIGPQGNVQGVGGISTDITERKRAEEALRESEKQVRRKLDAILSPEANISSLELSDIIDSEKIQKLMDKLYKFTNIGIGIIDIHGRVLVGTGWQEICTKFHRVNPETCRLCIESDLELSRDVPAGTLYRCKNNMWDMASPIKLGDMLLGNIYLGQFLFDDETVDYETFRQQALRYGFNEEEYIAALEKVPRWNRKTVDAVISFYTAFAEMIGNLSYANVKLAGALEDRKRAEEEILKLNTELEQRVADRTAQLGATNKELEAFAYSVSHDLRAPLRAIDGFSRMVLEDYIDKLDDEGKRFLNIIRGNTKKMGQLIDDLLEFSRLGRQEIRASGIDMGKLAKAVSEELKFAVPERKLKFTINTLIPAQGDQAMIRQVFVNLLSNAVKFTRPKERAVIEVDGRSEGDENIYYVKDDGVGFDMQYVCKLFGVFQRLHSSAEFEGTGVGLAIVQRIIHRHGGRVWAEGKVGEGATFYFTLPRREG